MIQINLSRPIKPPEPGATTSRHPGTGNFLRMLFFTIALSLFGGLLGGCLSSELDDPIRRPGDAMSQKDGSPDKDATPPRPDLDLGFKPDIKDTSPDQQDGLVPLETGPDTKGPDADGALPKEAGPDKTKTDGTPDVKKADGTKIDGSTPDSKTDKTIPGPDAKTDGPKSDQKVTGPDKGLDAQKPVEAGTDLAKTDWPKTDGQVPTPDTGPDASQCNPLKLTHGQGTSNPWNPGNVSGLEVEAGKLELEKTNPATTVSGPQTIDTLGTNSINTKTAANPSTNTQGTQVTATLSIDGEDNATPPLNSGFSLTISDGTREVSFNFFSNKVCEISNSGGSLCANFASGAAHTFTITMQDKDFALAIAGGATINGKGLSLAASSSKQISFGDFLNQPDAKATITSILAESLTYKASGTYVSSAQDTGFAGFNWQNTQFSFAGALNGGEVWLSYRTAATVAALSTASWSTAQKLPFIETNTVVGQYMQLLLNFKAIPLTLLFGPSVSTVTVQKTCP